MVYRYDYLVIGGGIAGMSFALKESTIIAIIVNIISMADRNFYLTKTDITFTGIHSLRSFRFRSI